MRRAAAAFVVLLLAAFVLLGCDGTHLAGTHDVELDYEVLKTEREVAAAATPPSATRGAVEARLGAAHVPADVEPAADGHLHVTVDGDSADAVDDVLGWRGGLAVYAIDATFAPTPADPAGLAGKTPAIELRDYVDFGAASDTASEKRDVVLYVHDAPKLRAAIEALQGRQTVVARGRRVLSRRPIGELFVEARAPSGRPALVLSMGDGVTAYSRAHSLRTLLRTGTLPPLVRAGSRALPVRWPLAVACFVVPMLLSFAWLFFVRRFDRAYPEPWWLVLVTFALGGLSVVPAGFLEWGAMTATPYLNPSVMTLGGSASSFPLALLVFTVVVGLSEEGAKLMGAWTLAARRPEFDEPVDGIVYGAASSLGFAAIENVKYFAFGRMGSAIIAARMFTSIPAHLFFGAIWGYALGKKLVSRRTSVLLFLGWAALMHGAFDTLLSIDGLGLLALALNLALASLFIVLLRRALRHGAVGPDQADAPPSAYRAFFRVGRPGAFAAAAVGLHLCAALLFALGVGHQATHQRITYAFVVFSSAVLGLLGLCAYALAATMPLDVAVDEHGVTFAGRAVPWSAIRSATLVPQAGSRAFVRLERAGGVTHLGPGRLDRMEALERMLEGRLHDARASS